MNKILTLLVLAMAFQQGLAQNGPNETSEKRDRFFLGLTYDYMHADMKLLSMTKHSVWNGKDLGTIKVTEDEIDSINSFMCYTEKFHDINLTAGMVLLNKPGSRWYIDGNIYAGFARRDNIILNTDNDTADVRIKSDHYSPSFGLGFYFRYMFNDKWGLNLGMSSIYAFGKGDKIDENIYPVVSFMEEERENIYRLSYSMVNLLVSYSVKGITIKAGPGFYYLYNDNKYHINRSEQADGATYDDHINTITQSTSFINGSAGIDWNITKHLKLSAQAGFGMEINARAGITYFL